MTLKDKFKTDISINTKGEASRFASKCEKIADEFASGFAEWCYDNDIFGFENVKELLEIYKKEKGL